MTEIGITRAHIDSLSTIAIQSLSFLIRVNVFLVRRIDHLRHISPCSKTSAGCDRGGHPAKRVLPRSPRRIEEDSVGEHACIAVVYKLVVVCLQTKIP